VTLWTRPIVAHATLPRLTQEPPAITCRTRPDENTPRSFNRLTMKLHTEPTPVPLFVLDIDGNITSQFTVFKTHLMLKNKSVKFVIETVFNCKNSVRYTKNSGPPFVVMCSKLPKLINIICNFANIPLKFNIGLCGGHEALLALEQQRLPTVFVSVTYEFKTEIVNKDLTTPTLTTRHAVGVLCSV
jgi:hypothetical protein